MRRAVDRYVDSLLRRRGRRPRPFAASEDDVAVARVAITLLAARSDTAEPRQRFVEDLRGRLEKKDADTGATVRRGGVGWLLDRRRLLQATAATVAVAASAGAVADHLVTGGADGAPGDGNHGELSPTIGQWQTVADSTSLPDGAAQPFDLGSVAGFVQRTGGRLRAVSGICTHQGCRLSLDAPGDRLVCPCHGATFGLDGQPRTSPGSAHGLPALPRLAVRDYHGGVQIFAPTVSLSG
jgi:nitrite reductase/ring-hydroxylating ferredoxin subunit